MSLTCSFVSPPRRIACVWSAVCGGWLVLAVGAIILAGCGNAETQESAGQVAARANGQEITLLQVNNALEREPLVESESAEARTWRVAQDVVQRELLVQQATKNQLDRRPEVMQAIAAARSQILAQSYLERVFAGVPPPNEQQVKEYYAAHPELFAQRRIYFYRELATDKSVPLERIVKRLEGAKSLDEMARWLDDQKANYAVRESIKPAEQIEPEVLSALHRLDANKLGAFDTDAGAYVVQLIQKTERPLTLEQAQPAISQSLTNAAREHALGEELKRATLTADIRWLGRFAELQAQHEQPVAAVGAAEDHVSKGAAGLR